MLKSAFKMPAATRAAIVLVLVVILMLTACSRRQTITQESFAFGTRVELLVWGVKRAQAKQGMNEVMREFDRLHNAYHAWQPSQLTALNEAIATGQAHKVSDELADLISTAQLYAKRSAYLFDPGIGRLVALWGFHQEQFKPALPKPAELNALVAKRPSINNLNIQNNVVTATNRLVALDFGGYLKGVALDHAALILKKHNIKNALINVGGNVMALGSKGTDPWRVGISHPRPSASSALLAVLALQDGEAIGTSGDYQRFFEINRTRYCHLIDPRSGKPATETQSLSVLIEAGQQAGMRSDVLSKPLFIAGQQWPTMAKRLSVKHVLRVDAAGRVYVTPALKMRLSFEKLDTTVLTAIVP